ncbi:MULTISPECIES: MFS transporter [unclassified Planococcus (in: firmicutes)]|uniref:MFS transporter n=1 Tax=unclassified Planococcus (in: firmicutes) TaxID=2662419 RepID=UPI000C3499BA|nr:MULTISPECIES: MFS transporter [unclassified Planococcus (in: firmicutes)]AUD13371.1 MFS transporter [Planococcus sp. MB-3u-03]PKG44650.1 MFS transporter [Planococcus sp. Urea-trap-24]PKG89284.1 MFS transporter [Planococcus sp. Urea-3u-39]PKH39908.1 MFS transporter [Planococcus sp. MB-3u-09]
MKYFLSSERARFWILVAIVSISGFSQGMLLPLIAVIFEQDGVSSALNGLSATGLYIGIIAVAPFMEPQLRKFGFKPLILVGGAMVILALLSFPLWKSVLFWFVLRILIGVGDQALHFSTQTWITSTSPHHKLGRNIAIYGMSFSVGFGAGPLFVPLVEVFEALPFIISGVLCLIAWSLVFFLRNDFPEHSASSMGAKGTLQRFRTALVIGWVAFLPPLGYGFLEASLSAIYPVYALRQSFDISMVSYILAAFSIGAIATQLPLGELSDRIGRKKVLMIALSGGGLTFLVATFFESNAWLTLALFVVAGMFVGSTFSLGISYMTDLMPKELLPTGNLLCGVAFSVGSLLGPAAGGLFLEVTEQLSFLLLITGILLTLFTIIAFKGPRKQTA